jgi:polysaccharide biosynthesis/export protein
MRSFKTIPALVILLSGAGLGQDKVPSPVPAGVPADSVLASLDNRGDGYRIGFQDILHVRVFRHPELEQRIAVNPNGTIVLFRLERPLVAVCKTERELADDIQNAYREKYLKDPQVSVLVAEQRSQSVMVIGAVEKPGPIFMNRRYHLLEMLAMAGGPSKEAGTRLLVARTGSTNNCRDQGDATDGDQVAVMDYKITDVREGRRMLWMQPGDVIYVLDADIIYVYGNVNKQGMVKVREPITLTQALVAAEGLRSAAKKDKIRVLRQSPGKPDRDEFVFDLNQIDKGKVKDPILEPNDIVAVSEDRVKSILNGIANSIKSTVPSAAYRFP